MYACMSVWTDGRMDGWMHAFLCTAGVQTPQCPFGSVHNVIKNDIGKRTALRLLQLRQELETFDTDTVTVIGPRAVRADASPAFTRQSQSGARAARVSTFNVTVTFQGGTMPLQLVRSKSNSDALRFSVCPHSSFFAGRSIEIRKKQSRHNSDDRQTDSS